MTANTSTAAWAWPGEPRRGIWVYVRDYLGGLGDLTGQRVVDLPCGSGFASAFVRRLGAEVVSLDLFPEAVQAEGVVATFADMNERLPVADASVDLVICMEGIEHVPDQLSLLREFDRILKPGGRLLLTTPSLSHARARVSWLLFETDFWRRMPYSTIDGVRVSESAGREYFGHVFLRGVQHFNTLLAVAGFRVEERRRTDVGSVSVLLGILLYPLLWATSWYTYGVYGRKRRGDADVAAARAVWRDQVSLNLAPVTVFCKHLLWIARKLPDAERRPETSRVGPVR